MESTTEAWELQSWDSHKSEAYTDLKILHLPSSVVGEVLFRSDRLLATVAEIYSYNEDSVDKS